MRTLLIFSITFSLLLLVAKVDAQYKPPTQPQYGQQGYAGPTCCTFYVSQSTGNDSNPGTIALPWQTISKVNGTTLAAGQSVGFKTGDTWRETLTPGQSGSAGQPITFASYGAGASPIVSGSNLVTSWTSETATEPTPAIIGGAAGACHAFGTSASCAATISTAGSMLAVTIFCGASSCTPSFTDTKGNSWTNIITSKYLAGSSWATTFYTAANNGAGADTFNITALSGFIDTIVIEWTGQAASGVLDGSAASNSNASGTSLDTGASSGSGSNTTDLIIGQFEAQNALSVGSGFTSLSNVVSVLNLLQEYKIGAGNSHATATQGSTGQWGGHTITFVAAGVLPTIYYASYSTVPNQVFRNGAILNNVNAKGNLTTGSWWLDTGNSRIYIFDNPSGQTMEASARTNAALIAGKSNITITGITFQEANVDGINVTGNSKRLAFSSISSLSNYGNGLHFTANFPNSNDGIGIQNSTFNLNQLSGVIHNGYADSWSVSGNNFNYNVSIECVADFCGGFRLITDSTTLEETNIILTGNIAHDNGKVAGLVNQPTGSGLWFDTVGTGNQMIGNISYNNNDAGVLVEGSDGVLVAGNVSYSNNDGIRFYNHVRNSRMIGNTVYGNAARNITMRGFFGGGDPGFNNNTVEDNLSMGTGAALNADFGANNDGVNGSGNVYLYNGFGVAASNFIEWGFGVNFSTYSLWEAASGNCGTTNCSHSTQADPLFVNAGAANFNLQAGSPAIGAGIFVAGVSTANPPNIGAK